MPASDLSKPKLIDIPHLDKVIHFGMYLVLSFILFLDISSKRKLIRRTLISVILATITMSGIVELIQEFWSSGRSADIFDLIANSFGTLVGFLFFILYRHKKCN